MSNTLPPNADNAQSIKHYPKTLMALFSYSGVHENTHECVMHEIFHAAKYGIPLHYARISGDALIERSRSRALGQFLKSSEDVIVMIDHDIAWRPGDVCELARLAHEKQTLVGGLYCKRAFKQGWASRIKNVVNSTFGEDTDNTIECDGLATGFVAIPRALVVDMVDKLNIDGDKMKEEMSNALKARDIEAINWLQDISIGFVRDGAYRNANFEYYDFFRCFRRRVPNAIQHEFLSEDWAFSIRAEHCGYKTFISTRPVLTHTGDYGYQITDGMDDQDRQKAAALTQEQLNGQNGHSSDPVGTNKKSRGAKGNIRKPRSSKGRDQQQHC